MRHDRGIKWVHRFGGDPPSIERRSEGASQQGTLLDEPASICTGATIRSPVAVFAPRVRRGRTGHRNQAACLGAATDPRAGLPSDSVADHPGPAGRLDLFARVLVRMMLVPVLAVAVTHVAHVLNHLWFVRASLVVRLGLVASNRLTATNMRTGDCPCGRPAASRAGLRLGRGSKAAPVPEGPTGAAIVVVQWHHVLANPAHQPAPPGASQRQLLSLRCNGPDRPCSNRRASSALPHWA